MSDTIKVITVPFTLDNTKSSNDNKISAPKIKSKVNSTINPHHTEIIDKLKKVNKDLCDLVKKAKTDDEKKKLPRYMETVTKSGTVKYDFYLSSISDTVLTPQDTELIIAAVKRHQIDSKESYDNSISKIKELREKLTGDKTTLEKIKELQDKISDNKDREKEIENAVEEYKKKLTSDKDKDILDQISKKIKLLKKPTDVNTISTLIRVLNTDKPRKGTPDATVCLISIIEYLSKDIMLSIIENKKSTDMITWDVIRSLHAENNYKYKSLVSMPEFELLMSKSSSIEKPQSLYKKLVDLFITENEQHSFGLNFADGFNTFIGILMEKFMKSIKDMGEDVRLTPSIVISHVRFTISFLNLPVDKCIYEKITKNGKGKKKK